MPKSTTKATPEPLFYSVKDVAHMLGISLQMAYNLVESQQIETRYIGKRRMVSVDALRTYVDNLPTERDA